MAQIAKLDRIYDREMPMEEVDGMPLTAAEMVLAYLLVEVVGVPDDVPYSPAQAVEIIEKRLRENNEKPAVLRPNADMTIRRSVEWTPRQLLMTALADCDNFTKSALIMARVDDGVLKYNSYYAGIDNILERDGMASIIIRDTTHVG